MTRQTYKPWTTDEILFLRKWFPKASDEELAKALNRTPGSIRGKRDELQVLQFRKWTPEEDDYLRECNGDPVADIAKELDRTIAAVHCRRTHLGLRRPGPRPTPRAERRAHIIEDIEYMLDSHASGPEMAQRLGMTEMALERSLSRWGRHDLARHFGRRTDHRDGHITQGRRAAA